MKKLYLFLLTTVIFLVSPKILYAVEDPLEQPNNKYGIHILSEHDLDNATQLVNSNGGAWGYVTLVIREDERDLNRWNLIFEKLKQKKLIPIVRIATTNQNGIWSKPELSQAHDWAVFLDQLPWPTKNRYLVLFNEPNHAQEWGGQINPEEYVLVARKYWEQLKRASTDFFVLPAGFDLASPNSKETVKATDFWEKMYAADELIFTIFDGWSSHAYPNPGFCGNPHDQGNTSISSYKWEIEYLAKYHLLKETPIFITETGWGCNLSEQKNCRVLQNCF